MLLRVGRSLAMFLLLTVVACGQLPPSRQPSLRAATPRTKTVTLQLKRDGLLLGQMRVASTSHPGFRVEGAHHRSQLPALRHALATTRPEVVRVEADGD